MFCDLDVLQYSPSFLLQFFVLNKWQCCYSCIDDSGTWGNGGMFNALTSLSTCISDAYHRASEFDDLHVGDLHLIQLNG
jgi:hypothetical protein